MKSGLLRRTLGRAVERAFAKRLVPRREAARADEMPPIVDTPPMQELPRRQSVRVVAEPNEQTVRVALSTVDDPEVGVDIVNLGLLRGWSRDGDLLHLRITATSPACPVGPHIVDMAREALASAFPDHTCSAELVWDPPWSFADMTDRARAWLGHGEPTREDDTMDQTLDIRPVAPRERHPLIFQTFEGLEGGSGFVLVNDHDPKPLYYQFQAEYGQLFGWEYIERGPEVWKVRISKAA